MAIAIMLLYCYQSNTRILAIPDSFLDSGLHDQHHHAVMHIIPDHTHDYHGNNLTLLPKKVPVVVWPLWEFGDRNTIPHVAHVEQNGIDESPLLELSSNIHNFDPKVVWVGYTRSFKKEDEWCAKFLEHVLSAKARRVELGLPSSWPIHIVDWHDYPRLHQCTNVEEAVGKEFVFYSQRSIVKRRKWNQEKGWVDAGTLINLAEEGGPAYRHTPLVVRTDIIENLKSSLRERGLTRLSDNIEALDRPIDVAHFWPVSPPHNNSKYSDGNSNLRTTVSKIVDELGNSAYGLNVFVGFSGSIGRQGRTGTSSAYTDVMLSTKIVLVTQRDGWEDHYRLFEALISGALVMTDHMLSLPSGLKNGSSILEFSSADELKSLIDYYLKHPEERLAIAQQGRHISMIHHRSWHRMEEIIFGRALTLCSVNPTGDCPYIVHANETSG
jgi:hypothetical protein